MGVAGRISSDSTRLIELQDGSYIEVSADEYESQPISSRFASRVSGSLDSIAPMIQRACRPVLYALERVQSVEGRISKAEVEIGFNLEAEGNVYIAQTASSASIKVKLVVERNPTS
ncbi:MAG: CU044_2847 family protein [Leptolyngbyaceae cyanobacterium]